MPVLNTASNIMIGATQAKKVYQGPTHVWPPAPQGFQASWTNADMNTLTWGTNPFNPRSITGLTAWFDASDTLPITSQWYDKSLTGHHGTIYGSPVPAIVSDMVGKLSVMRFTASQGRVRMTGTGITNDWTLVYVGRQTGGSGRIVSGGANNILVGWWGTQQDGAYDVTPGWLVPDVKITSDTSFTMYSADGSPATAMRLFKNGTLISFGSVAGNTGWGGTFNINGHGPDPGSTEMCNGEVCEVLLYNRKLSDTDRQQCETYLNNKWRGGSTYPEYYDIYYSTTLWSTSDEWLANGILLETRNTTGVQSYTHMKSAADKGETILYYALIKKNVDTGTISVPAVSAAPRVRGGTDWKQITIAPKSNKVQALYHIPSGTTKDANLVVTGGNYTVDWGDGTAATNHNAGDPAIHTYAYSSMPATGEIAAGRQAMATISAQSGQMMTGLGFIDQPPLPSPPPYNPTDAHPVVKAAGADWSYRYDMNAAPVMKPRDAATVWLKITPVSTGSFTMFTDGFYDTYGYLYQGTPTGPNYTDYIASDDDAGPNYAFQITATLTGGVTYYLAACLYDTYTGDVDASFVTVTVQGGATTGTGSNSYAVAREVSVASDTLRSLDVRAQIPRVNFLSKMTATTFADMFKNATGLVSVCGEMASLSTSANSMFYGATAMTSANLPRMATSAITDFTSMFQGCTNAGFTSPPVIDTSSGTTFDYMFYYCSALTSLPSYNLEEALSLVAMFYWCTSLTSDGTKTFVTPKVTNYTYLFRNCSNAGFTASPVFTSTSAGTNFTTMYGNTQINAFPNIDLSNATTVEAMFSNCAALPSNGSKTYDCSKVTKFDNMFYGCNNTGFTTPPNLTSTSAGTSFRSMFSFSKITAPPVLDTSNALDLSSMFSNCVSLASNGSVTYNTAKCTSFYNMFYGCNSPAFTVPPVLTSTAAGTNFSYMYAVCSYITAPPNHNTSNGALFSYMFKDCTGMTTLPDYDLGNATTTMQMFYNCTGLTSNGSKTYNLPKVVDVSSMFYNCNNVGFTAAPVLTNTSLATDFSSTYWNCSKMTALPVLNTSSATSFFNMFRGCRALTSNGSVTYNSANVTNFSQMFMDCDAPGFTVPPTLTSTLAGTSFNNMHNYNSYITAMPNYDTSNGTNFTGMFQGCGRLVNAGVRVYNTSKGTLFNYTFSTCNNVGFTTIPAWNMSAGTTFTGIFTGNTYVTLVNATGIRYSVNIGTCAASMSAANINTFLTNLGTAAGAQTVTLTGLTNQASSNKAIATAKGWTVTPA